MHSVWFTASIFGIDFILRLYFCVRVVQRRLPVGVAWAWIGLILCFPLFGTVIYLYLGEYRLGRRRTRRLEAIALAIRSSFIEVLAEHAEPLHEATLPVPTRSFAVGVRGFFDSPLLLGNDVELLQDADRAFPCLISEINQAKLSCDMEFYIWSDGGRADDFGEALIAAAKRGVHCRVLVDQIGSARFIKGDMAKKLVAAGVDLCVALPSGLIRSFIARPDLRIHRKIVVIDGRVAFTGSLNLADPILFKKEAGVGQWVDALCRITGPAVRALELVFLCDWCVERNLDFSEEEAKISFQDLATKRSAKIQCLPSGPAVKISAIEEVIIMAIYSAQKKLVLTTPYFVPNESVLYALIASACRGVDVTLIVPAVVDSKLINYASRAFLSELVEAGVRVALFNDGLLHTKSVTVDGEYCIFGSLNLDPRSLRINFEISLAIYDTDFVESLLELQNCYLSQSTILNLAMINKQGPGRRFLEALARLAGPIL